MKEIPLFMETVDNKNFDLPNGMTWILKIDDGENYKNYYYIPSDGCRLHNPSYIWERNIKKLYYLEDFNE